jgi:hypothetical protein
MSITFEIKRNIIMCGESLVITIPGQIVELHNIKEED